MIAAALSIFAAAAVPTAPANPVLDCRLVTPGGDDIAFAARLDMPTGVLEPASGAWPTRRVIGPGGWRTKKGLEAVYHFAGSPNGLDLVVIGERATLFLGKELKSGQPRAYGFCLPASNHSPAAPDALVSPDAGADVPAFSSANWPEGDCAFITRSGRRGRIGYEIIGNGARSVIKSSEPDLLPSSPVSVPRTQGYGRTPTRFGGREGPSGAETLVVDAKAGEAVQLIDFDRIGTAAAEPAAAICGHKGIVRRPDMQ